MGETATGLETATAAGEAPSVADVAGLAPPHAGSAVAASRAANGTAVAPSGGFLKSGRGRATVGDRIRRERGREPVALRSAA